MDKEYIESMQVLGNHVSRQEKRGKIKDRKNSKEKQMAERYLRLL
jgi:hypothetical protein